MPGIVISLGFHVIVALFFIFVVDYRGLFYREFYISIISFLIISFLSPIVFMQL